MIVGNIVVIILVYYYYKVITQVTLGSVMIGLEGLELNAEEKDLLRHPLVGGVILFSRNYRSPEQVAELVASIHALRQPRLLVAVDHEGGRVQRFRRGPQLPLRHPHARELRSALLGG